MTKSTLASIFLLLALTTQVVAGREGSVAELRRLRGNSRGLYQFGGDNGRDHPQNYPKPAPTEDTTQEVRLLLYCCR